MNKKARFFIQSLLVLFLIEVTPPWQLTIARGTRAVFEARLVDVIGLSMIALKYSGKRLKAISLDRKKLFCFWLFHSVCSAARKYTQHERKIYIVF